MKWRGNSSIVGLFSLCTGSGDDAATTDLESVAVAGPPATELPAASIDGAAATMSELASFPELNLLSPPTPPEFSIAGGGGVTGESEGNSAGRAKPPLPWL